MKVGFLKISLLLACVSLVSGCNQEKSSARYLMRHPEVLQKEFDKCHADLSAHCEMVRQAALSFDELSQERASDQEGFGKKIMEAEMELVKINDALQVARKQYLASPDKMELQKIVEVLEQTYRTQADHVDALLAVASAGGSPA